MRFKKLITLLITVIICATLALGYQQDPLRRGLPNPFSGAGLSPIPTYGDGDAVEIDGKAYRLKCIPSGDRIDLTKN